MDDAGERLLTFIKSHPKGISDKEIQKEVPGMDNPVKRAKTLNYFITHELITLYKQPSGKIIYKIKTVTTNVDGLKDADNEEKVVFTIISDAGNKGIWIRDIRTKSNLTQPQLNKIMKNLESKKMIKSVQTVTAGKKKVYMLHNLEPDATLTGGAWYSDRDFDSDFVDGLNQVCYRFLKNRNEEAKKLVGGPLVVNNASYASVHEICAFINKLGLSTIPLSEDDIEQILTTLIYDGKIERKLVDDVQVAGTSSYSPKVDKRKKSKYLYKAVRSLLPPPGFVATPCGVCPVFKNCDMSTAVNPRTCNYLADWLTITHSV